MNQRRRSYRIGYLCPWTETAENQALASLSSAARLLGHEMILMATSTDITRASPDFVIAAASGQPKMTYIPTFASVHEPRVRYWENEAYFANLLTYDGYLTISKSLRQFLSAFCSGFGKEPAIGFYYNTPQRQGISADIPWLVEHSMLRLCYFGTNWDPRSRPLFRELARRPYFEARGPARSWAYLQRGYCGQTPFDGQSVQSTYAAKGAGLVVLSRNHALDDIISNRIFEITSVGAAAICPDQPWIREQFGDSVFYYDAWAPASKIATRVDEIMDAICADPESVVERAASAREIFDRSFCAERMIENAVSYFEEWRERTEAKGREVIPRIDIVVRVGGRPNAIIARAVRSIDAQTQGSFRVILVRYKDVDLSEITGAKWSRIEEFDVVDCFEGDRAATLGVGVGALRSPYFAVLDDDDFWLPDHIASLWRVLKPMRADSGMAYGAMIEVVEGEAADGVEARRISKISEACGTIWDIMGRFGMNSFLAAAKLTEGLNLGDWTLSTAEDTVLIGHMLARAECAFSWRATACVVVSAEAGSNFRSSTNRSEDVFEAFSRLGSRIEEIERKFAPTSLTTWARLGETLQSVFEDKSKRALGDDGLLVMEDGMIGVSIHEREDVALTPIEISPATTQLAGASRFESEGLTIIAPDAAWAYVAQIDVSHVAADEAWIALEFASIEGSFGVGLLDKAGAEFHCRFETPRRAGPVELWMHVAEGASLGRLVVQNWATVTKASARLLRVWIVKRKEIS